MTKQQFIVYIAALFDGEGHFYVRSRLSKRDGNIDAALVITQNALRGRMVLEKIQSFLLVGKVESKDKRKGDMACWRYAIYKKGDIKTVILKILPYLLIKEREAHKVLYFLDKWGRGESFSINKKWRNE